MIAIIISLIVINIFIYFEYAKTKKYLSKIKIRRLEFDEKYDEFLVKECDTRLIYNKFLEDKVKLPDDLHNIMLLFAISKDYYALEYIKKLDIKTNKMKKTILHKKIKKMKNLIIAILCSFIFFCVLMFLSTFEKFKNIFIKVYYYAIIIFSFLISFSFGSYIFYQLIPKK